jgi:predicted Zn-dependent peptidase
MMGLESPLARAGQLARHILIYGRPLSFDELVARIESVDARMISDLAAKILSSTPTLAAIGPLANLPSAADMARRIGGANGVGAR